MIPSRVSAEVSNGVSSALARRIFLTGLATGLAIVVVASRAAAESPSVRWIAPTTLTDARSNPPALDLNERGDAVVAWHDVASNSIVVRYRSADTAWGAPRYLQPGTYSWITPAVALDPYGNAIVAWTAGYPETALWTTSRVAESGVWTKPVRISASRVGTDSFGVVFDATGNATAAWVRSTDDAILGYANTLESAYRPAKGPWGAPAVVVSAPAPSAISSLVLVGNDSTTLLAWHEWSAGKTRISATVGRKGSWESAETFATGVGGYVNGALGEDGTAVVGWTHILHGNSITEAVVRPPGGGWESPAALSFEDGQAYGPSLAIDGQGNATAVWLTNFDFEASYRPANSDRWQRPVAISDPTGGVAGSISLAVNRNGDTGALWNIRGDIQATVRQAGGTIWDPPVPISGDEKVNIYDRTGLSLDAAGDAIAVWALPTDSRVTGVRIALLDTAAPTLASLRVPTRGRARKPIPLSASFRDISSTAIRWEFGDGAATSGRKVVHAYRHPGRYSITVIATDAAGHVATVTRGVQITR